MPFHLKSQKLSMTLSEDFLYCSAPQLPAQGKAAPNTRLTALSLYTPKSLAPVGNSSLTC